MSPQVTLSDEECALLDGRVGEKAQAVVDAAKARLAAREAYSGLAPLLAALVADVLTEATTHGRLTYQHTRIRYCHYCERGGGYVHFKSGRNRGMADYKRPLTLDAVEFAYRFVRIERSVAVGACGECVASALPTIREALRGVRAELPEPLRIEGEPTYKHYDRRTCKSCGWTGHEGLMGRLPALMGGTYPGICPQCKSEQKIMGRTQFDSADGFDVVEVAAVRP